MRVHLFEFEDFSWFPDSIRQGGTDYLRYFLKATSFYSPITPIIADVLKESGEKEILYLCSGGGGPIEYIAKNLTPHLDTQVNITISDKFPNINAFQYIKEKSGNTVQYSETSVDATKVSKDIKGLRTMFSAVHHFSPDTIKAILKDAVDNNAPVALFDGGDKNIFVILGIILFHPIAFLLFTPFFKPYKLSRFFYTYIIPLIPITTVWDGCVSILRLYKPKELLQIAKLADTNENYIWKAGKAKNKLGMNVTYLTGYPKKINYENR